MACGDDNQTYPRFDPPRGDKLEMVRRLSAQVPVPPVPEGYRLRMLEAGEEPRYAALYRLHFDDMSRLAEMPGKTLPGGCFVVEHPASRRLVASCRAYYGKGRPRHPQGGQLAWLIVDPAHGRKRLGTIVAAIVTNRLAQEGYQRPFLRTDDARLPAISIYLRLGWQPDFYMPDMHGRWERIFAALGPAGNRLGHSGMA
jgi:ribosomal protein S18 acetylase RimI-like enzyme